MKVFNEIQAEIAGQVAAVLVENGQPVEFGQPLFKVDTRSEVEANVRRVRCRNSPSARSADRRASSFDIGWFRMFKRILVANRGEIALRVIRACRELGIETVAVFSEADRGAALSRAGRRGLLRRHRPRRPTAICKIDRVISAAEIGNVQAIHPGYGFLSENAHFAEVCRSCKIDFIGPTPEAMSRLGDKNEARRLAREAERAGRARQRGLDRQRGRGRRGWPIRSAFRC